MINFNTFFVGFSRLRFSGYRITIVELTHSFSHCCSPNLNHKSLVLCSNTRWSHYACANSSWRISIACTLSPDSPSNVTQCQTHYQSTDATRSNFHRCILHCTFLVTFRHYTVELRFEPMSLISAKKTSTCFKHTPRHTSMASVPVGGRQKRISGPQSSKKWNASR